MKTEELARRLETEHVVCLTADAWAALADGIEEVERHSTGVAGDLLIVRVESHLAAVEEPSSGERVLRRLADADEAGEFVRQRLEQYERMWDGCGCMVDYYS